MINKSFTFLWLGKIISQIGDKFYAIALAWWILQRTNSPTMMGFFLLASALPGILLGMFAGVFADRWNKKIMIAVTDALRGVLVLLISLLSLIKSLEIWHVFLIAIGLSLITAFFDPAVQAIIPEIVEKEKLPQANSMSQMVSGICTVVGPLFGAVAVGIFGLTLVFFANSISYFISAILNCFIKTKTVHKSLNEKPDIWLEMKEGIAFIRNQKRITLVIFIIAVAHLFVGGLTVTLPFLAKALNGSGINNLGYLEMMLGAGLFSGSVILRFKKRLSVNEQTLILLILVIGFCFVGIAGLQWLRIGGVYAYMFIMTAVGICVTGAFVFWQTLLQHYTPMDMTGRVFSVSSLVGNVSLPIAYGLFGMLLNVSSIPILMAFCGICLIGLYSRLSFIVDRTQ